VSFRLHRFLIAIPAIGLSFAAFTWLTLPDVRPLRSQNPGPTAFMKIRADEAARAGKPVRAIQRWVGYDHVSESLKKAILVSEDAKFWQHDGVDYGEVRASLREDWASGRLPRGASTLTQQLAKNLYLSPSRNPYRKFTELMITRRLEVELGKRRIFELYLNEIEWGDGIWGAEAASRAYFGVSAADLSPSQAALLAGAIINPRVYSPAHPNARLLQRQQIILGKIGETSAAPAASGSVVSRR
jgi:monofunctional biosynthetic peptidoglycan transglycosylase